MKTFFLAAALLSCLAHVATCSAQQHEAPKDIGSERQLPSRYPFVVRDILNFCKPTPGFWIDLGAGKGQITIPLIEATGNPVTMLDPDAEAMCDGLERARQMKLDAHLFAVVGVAEQMPFPDNTVDLVVSRGSIFFWDDPAKGLREVYRVLRAGGSAYIGGGAGSKYPEEATRKLIAQRKKKIDGPEAKKWRRFVDLRRPEKMQQWAEEAGLVDFTIMGHGALSAQDSRVGQGIWLRFSKPEIPSSQPNESSR